MKNLARRLRQNPTRTEDLTWQVLRRMKAEGVHVRRQHAVAGYVVDFAVLSARLAIELDGGVHRMAGRAA